MTTGGVIDAILMDEEHSEDDSDTDEAIQIQAVMKHKAINRLSCKSSISLFPFLWSLSAVVSDLLMNEAIANYARAKVEKNEDSGVESANSLDNTGEVEDIFGNIKINQILASGSESNSENSSHEDFTEHKVIVQINNQDRDVEVTHL